LGPNKKVKKGLLPLEILGFSKTKASNPPPLLLPLLLSTF
jgi:hypothetical protein